MAPFLNNELFSLDVGLVLSVLIGIGFGFSLERGGFGSSRKLAAQFYLYDMTVFKVMFTAIITAMVGLFGLTRLGFITFDALYINDTYLWAQIAGGLMLGAGFIISGYCPGTSIVATASGKIDGMLTLLGVAAGIFLFGVFYTPELQAFHKAAHFERLLLSDLLNIDPTIVATAVVIMAGMAFIFAEWVERKFKSWGSNDIIPAYDKKVRYAVMGTVVTFAIMFALPFSTSVPTLKASTPDQEISSFDLAQLIIEQSSPVTIFDLRPEKDIEAGTLPGAIPAKAENLAKPGFWKNNLPKHHSYILIPGDGKEEGSIQVPAGFKVKILKDGYEGWKNAILTKPENMLGSAMSKEEMKLRMALYSYFTGAALEAPKVSAPALAITPGGGNRKKKPSGGC